MAETDKSSKKGGFEEAPQAPLTGTPLSGDISSWAEEIEAETRSGGDGKPAKSAKQKKPSADSIKVDCDPNEVDWCLPNCDKIGPGRRNRA